MLLKEKASELRQQRSKLLDESREICERITKENRDMSVDENDRHRHICGDGTQEHRGEAILLAERISQIERQIAVDTNGPEPTERRSAPLPHEDPANVGTRHRYSLLRAAKCRFQGRPVDGLEGEVSTELEKRSGKSPLGFLMPYRTSTAVVGGERRALDTSAPIGGASVPTILTADWIELLRARMVLMQAGATQIMDLQGKFAIPRQNAAATAYWVAESGAPTGSNQTLDQVLFTPKTIGAFTDISRRFFELTILDSGEEFVKSDLTAILARGVDLAAFNGSGANTPLGILQDTTITATRTVSLGTTGGAPTWMALVELNTIVSRGNAADLGAFVYVTNADGRGTMATTAKIGSTYPVFLLEDGKIYGMPAYFTQMIPNNLTKGAGVNLSAIIGMIANQNVLAYWSGIDILVDPYTGSSSGTVRIVALQDMDVQRRHPEAFAVIVDMTSNQLA
jgi:HK97 family phage major capsid protein